MNKKVKKQNINKCQSKLEQQIRVWIASLYDVEIEYMSNAYPFFCDFFIPELDLYIEIQSYMTHGPEPFNSKNKEHIALLKKWHEYEEDEHIYTKAIDTWARHDVKKRKKAIKNNLKYLEFYGSTLDEFKDAFHKYLKNKTPHQVYVYEYATRKTL